MIVDVETRYGVIAVTDQDTHQYDWFRRAGMGFDHSEIMLVRSLLGERPRGVVVDVGASFGSWSLALAPAATGVLAFEPQSAIFDLLCRTIRLNHVWTITACRRAVGDEVGVATILRPDLDAPANFGGVVSLCDVPAFAVTEDVAVTTLDRECAGLDVSLIKIDVEGYEQRVLSGAVETIARCRPILAVERMHEHTDTAALELQILEMGYAIVNQVLDFVCVPLNQ